MEHPGQAASDVRGLTTLVLAPCSFPPRGVLSGPACPFSVSRKCLPAGMGLSVGDSDLLATWQALNWTEASPSAGEEPSFPSWSPLHMEEKQIFLSNPCLGLLSGVPNSMQAWQAGQGTHVASSHLASTSGLAIYKLEVERSGRGFPRSWPQFPPLAPVTSSHAV